MAYTYICQNRRQPGQLRDQMKAVCDCLHTAYTWPRNKNAKPQVRRPPSRRTEGGLFFGPNMGRPSSLPTRRSSRQSSRRKPEGGKMLGHCQAMWRPTAGRKSAQQTAYGFGVLSGLLRLRVDDDQLNFVTNL